MKKLIVLSLLMFAIGMMTACKGWVANNAVVDRMTSGIMAENTDNIILDTEIKPIDTTDNEQDEVFLSDNKTFDINLPLYTFKSQEVHDKLLQIVNEWKDDGSELEITFWTIVDTKIAYGEDTILYRSKLMLESVHYDYHGDAYEDISSMASGCCMVGKKFCYITSRLTRDCLINRTDERKHHKVYSSNTVGPCREYNVYFLLREDDNIVHLSFDYKNLPSIVFPNR